MTTFETSAHYFRFFASEARRGGSPLYARLALGIAEHAGIQRIAARRRRGQPPANLILGAVHALLLRGTDHPLAEYYPSVGGTRPVDETVFGLFAAFCHAHEPELVALVASRVTNTNEVGRSALLVPAFEIVARLAEAPLGIVEIGCSAGLNLHLDRYGYRYTDEQGVRRLERWAEADLVLCCALEGGGVPSLGPHPPPIASRVGLELCPIDPAEEDERRWLKALVWPERTDRLARLEAALAIASRHPVRIVSGDAVENLADALAGIPPGQARCVYHTVMSYQLSAEQFRRIDRILLDASRTAPVWRVSVEGEVAQPNPTATVNPLRITRYLRAERAMATLATCDPHGLSMAWTHDLTAMGGGRRLEDAMARSANG